MAVVKGVKERVHLPIYDSLTVEPEQQMKELVTTNAIKFFVDVQGKSKLETNLQSASLLPHYNTFEARAMRVVISDLPPKFSDSEDLKNDDKDFDVLTVDEDGVEYNVDSAGNADDDAAYDEAKVVSADVELTLIEMLDLLEEARESEDGFAELDPDDERVTLIAEDAELTEAEVTNVLDAEAMVYLSIGALEDLIDGIPKGGGPPKLQIKRDNGAGNLIGKFIYNTVTTFYVGEKVMVQMPTWFFPGGAGPHSETAPITTHGEPDPMATFRFAEPIFIDKQQNFRVEIEIPDADVAAEFKRLYGPLFIWVVVDGYMTRDVQ